MSARTKLNVATINGAILVAGLAGWALGSWPVFLLGSAALITLGLHAGDIRPGRRR
jgi:hypothetical protein